MLHFVQRVSPLWLCLGLFPGAARGVVVVWIHGGANTRWETAGNWSSGQPGSGDIASFNGSGLGASPTIRTNSFSVGALEFLSGADAKTIGGSGILTIAGVGGAGITNSSGVTQTFAPGVAIGSSQTWTTSGAASNLTFSRTLDLAGYSLTVDSDGGTTVALSTGNGDIISGTGSAIVKNGAGTLSLQGNVANTFDGGFTLNDGTVSIGNNASLGTGTLTLAGGTLSASKDKVIANALDLTGAATISGTSGTDFNFQTSSISVAGGSLSIENADGAGATAVATAGFSAAGSTLGFNIAIGSNAELDFLNPSGTVTFSGNLSGAGGVRQNSGGTALLSGTNSYSGVTLLDAGTIEITNNTALGSSQLDLSGGTLVADGALTLGNNLRLSGASTINAT
ncbi:MAG TPA: autotransporter-associated beta strand repeat-containing protein, partial [Opitutus sp.]|nr:autotransporter-associated beta strand repeat-containing protein [Opitutus sp.]